MKRSWAKLVKILMVVIYYCNKLAYCGALSVILRQLKNTRAKASIKFYGCNLRLFVTSWSVYLWQVFRA
jgi:hypothetical protein